MPWNGSGVALATDGTFTGTAIWTQEKNAANLVTAAHFDTYTADILGMFNNCVTRDGQGAATLVNLPATTNATTGTITIGGVVFASFYGTNNAFVGGAGTFSGSGGLRNVGVGINALNAVNGSDNVAVGFGTLPLTGNQQSVAVGSQAMLLTTGQSNNTAIGYFSMENNQGSNNTFVGYLTSISGTGSGNSGLGSGCGSNLTTGANNVFLGSNSFVTTGSNNVQAGVGSQVPSATANGQLSIQNALYGTGNTATGASVSAGGLGVFVTAPTARLHLPASTTAAGSSPLKITAGTLMTTPENGAIEFDGTHVYMTIGGVRKQLDN